MKFLLFLLLLLGESVQAQWRPPLLGLLNPRNPGPWWSAGSSVGNLNTTYTEYSGLAAGKHPSNRGYLWSVEDGATAYIIAIDKTNATFCGKWTLTGVTTSDMEDIDSAVVNGQPYIYASDSGDNPNTRSNFTVIRIKEPVITRSDGTVGAPDIEQIIVSYPYTADFPSNRDCETLMVDPNTGDMYWVTKRITPVKMYKLAHAASYTGTNTLEFCGNLSSHTGFNTISTTQVGANGYAVGGSICPSGREILIKSYATNWWWSRDPFTQTIYQALTNPPTAVEYVGGGEALRSLHDNSEPQGEAICWDQDGQSIYTCSEFLGIRGSSSTAYPLFKYLRLPVATTAYSFQDGVNSYTGTIDTYLNQALPTTAFTTTASIIADYDYSAFPTTSNVREILLRFDVSSIPATATVVSAALDLYINTEGLGLRVLRMKTNWAETVTWDGLTAGVAVDDTDCASVPDAVLLDAVGEGWDTYVGPVHINVPVATVQLWVSNSSTNFGWLITGPVESTGDGLQIDSREGATVARRPKLTVKTVSY